MCESLSQLAELTTKSRTSEQYEAARTEWLHSVVGCDTIYQGAVAPTQQLRPIVTGIDPAYTADCESTGDRYWPDRIRLNAATRKAGAIALDLALLPARERRERVFYREVVAGLGLRAIGVAIIELRGAPLSCIYFGRTSRRGRFERDLERLRSALPILALGEALHHARVGGPTLYAGLTRREDEIVQYIVHGLTNGEIARLLGTSPATVKNQVASILRKVGAANRTELAWRARG